MTSTTPATPFLVPALRPTQIRAWIILWALVVLAVAVLLWNNAALDTRSWLATRDFLNYPEQTPKFYRVLRFPGDPRCTVLVVILIAVVSKYRLLAVPAAIAATALAGVLGDLIRRLDGRFRPTNIVAANHWEPFRGFSLKAPDLAFPSGHATLAFATAAVLSYLFPRGTWFFIPAATICAWSRVAQRAHFYSDIIFGAALGWTVAWFTMHLILRRFASAQK